MPVRPPQFRPAGAVTRAEVRTRYDELRGTSTQRGYDRSWQRCRSAFLAVHPLCAPCLAKRPMRVKAAEQVHHVQAIAVAPERRLDWSNLLAVCAACHAVLEAEGRKST